MTQSDSQQIQDWMEKGSLHLQCLNYVEALACFNQALNLNPSSPEIWSKCGTVLEKLGCYQEAIAVNQTVQKLLLNPGLTILAPTLVENPAVIAANQALRSTAQYWLNRGATLYTLGRYAEAMISYDKAIEINPDNHGAWSNRSLVLYVLGHCEDAIASYDKVLELKPDDYYAWTGRGNALKSLDRYEAAIFSYNKAIEIQPGHGEAIAHRTLALDHIDHYKSRLSKEDTVIDAELEQRLQRQEQLNALPAPPTPEPIDETSENYQDYFWRANECYALGQYEAAIANYDQTVALQPDYHKAWYNRGIALHKLNQYEAAIASYDKALAIKPDKHQAWFHRGISLAELGQVEAAIASYDKALEIQPNYPDAWANRGTLLINLPLQPQETDPADTTVPDLSLPNFATAHELDNSATEPAVLEKLELGEQSSLEQVPPPELGTSFAQLDQPTVIHELIEPEPGSLADLNGHSAALGENNELTIAYEDIALELESNDLEEWDDFGDTLPEAEAIATISDAETICLPQAQQWMVWDYRGLTALDSQNYKAALALWDQGITTLRSQDADQRYGCGKLYMRKGRTQYYEARQQPYPIPEWIAARDSFLGALDCFTYSDFPEQNLETLQELLRVCYHLEDTDAIQQILQQGTAILASMLQNPQLTRNQKIGLEAKFAGFAQLQVDLVANHNPMLALELAEANKNRRLGRLRGGWLYQPPQAQIQTLLTPGTAIVYWHISPAALTTFVLKYNQPPQVVQSTLQSLDQVQHPELRNYPTATYQLRRFEAWMQQWKRSYQQYCTLDPDTAISAPWRQNMEPMLYIQLRKILEINRLCTEYLKEVDRLILIPHRDLHLLPLQALFPGRFTISYLPSFQLGLDLQPRPDLPVQRLLSVDGLTNYNSSQVFAQLELAVVTHLYGKVRSLSIPGPVATNNKVVSALKMMSGCFHFAGDHVQDMDTVQNSSLVLADAEKLTLEDILKLDLSRYSLVCLTASQTGIANIQSTIVDEYVSLTTAFLSAGVTYVVGTLWTVDAVAKCLLTIQLHRLLLQKTAPVQALRMAQDWLSTLTYVELSEWYQDLATQLKMADPASIYVEKLAYLAQSAVDEPDPDAAPYAHPFYWAGFTITGKVPETPPATLVD